MRLLLLAAYSFDFGLVEHEIVGFACKSKRARLLGLYVLDAICQAVV